MPQEKATFVNRIHEIEFSAVEHCMRDRFHLRSIVVFLSANLFAVLFCSSVTGQPTQRKQQNPIPLPGYSILETGERPVRTPANNSAAINSPPAKTSTPTRADAGEDIDKVLTKLVLENIPHDFHETKDWGGQDERWDGVKIRREGLKIETQRRMKMVNHGTWKKYSAQLRNPNEEFTIQVKNMRETVDDKLAFDVHFLAHLNLDGRQSKWIKGVQLYSVGVEGHAKIRLVVSMELEVKMGGAKFPPDIVFVPRAIDAELVLDDFRIDRIGKVGGEFAQQVSKGIRSKLDEKVAQKKVKLLDKINRQLTKKQDELRISIADAMKTKWTNSAKAFLPDSIQASLID